MSDFIKKLISVQAELKAPKSNYNSFGKYNYRSTEDILTAVKPLLKEAGLTMTISDEMQQVGDRYYIRATVAVTDGTEQKAVTAYAREEESKKGMDAAQVTGAASSYARKYALNGMFLIDDTKDPDTNEYTKASGGPSKPTISAGIVGQLKTVCIKHNIPEAVMAGKFLAKGFGDITVEEYERQKGTIQGFIDQWDTDHSTPGQQEMNL